MPDQSPSTIDDSVLLEVPDCHYFYLLYDVILYGLAPQSITMFNHTWQDNQYATQFGCMIVVILLDGL